ncbi:MULTISPECIES: hypothetical protein [unclassified Cognatiyoonia]|uniref:hypothetical protein n=1 Tax=unclassified Cognatiyoonia TaxID=2635977 RepID=UPI002A0CE160|nr:MULTISPECIES: hypothetical protein [unclassified Cognatiyoonia]MDX8349551.1 hypothetical protein [Cognatiyoonia sp. IB215446]MDX8352322.1 hypothetical protein [Cognatiyoonia sp. IB215182]
MSENKIWEAIAQSSSRELFNFVMTLETHFAFKRLGKETDAATDVSEGELAQFLFEIADEQATPVRSNVVEVKS